MRRVSWLAELGKDDGALAGGKGANLGELLRASLPVPPGFVVTTAAYRHFVAANSLQPEIERLAQAAPPEDLNALTAAANAIGALFAKAIMPPRLRPLSARRTPLSGSLRSRCVPPPRPRTCPAPPSRGRWRLS
jgi:rifampicin phosphotransferase